MHDFAALPVVNGKEDVGLARYIKFRIVLESSPNCDCENQQVEVTAKQTLVNGDLSKAEGPALEQLKAVGFRESFDTPDPDVIEEEEEELDAEE